MEELTIIDVMKLSPPLALGALLLAVGTLLKKSKLPDWLTPVILALIGAGIFPFVIPESKVGFECPYPKVLLGIYGALTGLAATGLHQIKRQFVKRDVDEPPQSELDSTRMASKEADDKTRTT